MIVRSSPIVVSASAAVTTVKAMANRPKSSGAKIRARVTERRNPMNCPSSDEETFQLMPERTLVTSGKVVAIYPSCNFYHNTDGGARYIQPVVLVQFERLRRRRWLIRAQGWSPATTLGEQDKSTINAESVCL